MDASQVIGIIAPSGVNAGDSFSATITMKNVGDTVWNEAGNVHLGAQDPQDNTIWSSVNRLFITGNVNPGEQYDFTKTFTAPATAGNYNFSWQMVRDGVAWFGPTASQVIAVSGSAPPPPPPPPPPGGVMDLNTDLPSTPPADSNELVSAWIFNTQPYLGDNIWRQIEWQNNTGHPLKLKKIYLWTGVGYTGRCDVHVDALRDDGEILHAVQWDHYAEPTAPQNGTYNNFDPYMRIAPGQKLIMRYFANFFDGDHHAHHQGAIWVQYD